MWPNRIRSAFLTFAFTALLAGSAVNATGAACGDDRVLLRGDSAVLQIQVEIAADADSRARGLMFRRSLPQGQGMLFVYPRPTTMFFWMRNTFIPLDMIFIDDRGVIRLIHPDARPLDETPIPGAAPGDPDPERLMVLEIGGGEAARLGLRVGQVLAHPRLPQARAAWPCR